MRSGDITSNPCTCSQRNYSVVPGVFFISSNNVRLQGQAASTCIIKSCCHERWGRFERLLWVLVLNYAHDSAVMYVRVVCWSKKV